MPPYYTILLCRCRDLSPFGNDRETFTDSHWRNSCEYTLRLAVSLASCVAPFAEDPYLPPEHAKALSLVVRFTERCREFDKGGEGAKRGRAQGLPAGLHSSLKYCVKKNGLGKSASEVRRTATPSEERVGEVSSSYLAVVPREGWKAPRFLPPQGCLLARSGATLEEIGWATVAHNGFCVKPTSHGNGTQNQKNRKH